MEDKSLLLHVCCAPCSIAIIDELRRSYDLTAFFYNPNIYPEAEYLKRKAEVVRVCEEWRVPMIDADYEPGAWESACMESSNGPEGGSRCTRCFRLRLGRAAREAAERGLAWFATSLSSGRQKSTEVINGIGLAEGAAAGVRFLDTDWKKGGRQERAEELVRRRGIYRQDYCGCRFSKEARERRR